MASAALFDNLLHRLYWRSLPANRFTVSVKNTGTSTDATIPEGFGAENLFDNLGHTAFKIGGNTQVDIILSFPNGPIGNLWYANGFAVYGHNLTSSQSITIQTSNDAGTSYSNFLPNHANISNGTFGPTGDRFHAFAGYSSADTTGFNQIKITTVGFTQDTFISCLSLGMFLDEGIELSAPFSPPYFNPTEFQHKRNVNGNLLGNQVRKIPQRLKLNIKNQQESDLEATGSTSSYEALHYNSETDPNRNFIEYVGDNASRFPFFLIWNTGVSTESAAEQRADVNQVYFCHANKTIQQPKFNNETTLQFSMDVQGYIK